MEKVAGRKAGALKKQSLGAGTFFARICPLLLYLHFTLLFTPRKSMKSGIIEFKITFDNLFYNFMYSHHLFGHYLQRNMGM